MSARSSTTTGELGRRALLALALAAAALLCAVGCSKPEPASDQVLEVRVAAAADLSKAFGEISEAYEQKTGKKVKATLGSTGLLSKQIVEGAPFDVFFAANVSFVDKVLSQGACEAETKALYARGRIVLWSKGIDKPKTLADLKDGRFRKIAIANPEHAPYGKAAEEALRGSGLWEEIKPKLAFGENVQQTLQFAQTGNADAAIVALSLAITSDGDYTLLDESLHQPLDQALVVCGKGARGDAGRDFAQFVSGPEGRAIMKKYGFLLPGETLSIAEK